MAHYYVVFVVVSGFICNCVGNLSMQDESVWHQMRAADFFRKSHQFEKNKLQTSFVPGSKAQSFKIWTLTHGQITYPSPELPSDVPIGFHSFTNQSGFLECMWTKPDSLADFVKTSPENVRYVFMTFDQNAYSVVNWMRNQLEQTLFKSGITKKQQQQFLANCYFVITPLSEIGNWLSSILSDWSCTDHGCGLNQVLFSSKDWEPSIQVSKRVDARYDWVFQHEWKPSSPNVILLSDVCSSRLTGVNGSVAVIQYITTGCSIANKVIKLQQAGAVGVLVYSSAGFPLQDLNCFGSECNTAINIPVVSIPYNDKLLSALANKATVTASLQTTSTSNFYFTIDGNGNLVEPGWFLYPSLQFLAWQMQWLVFDDNLLKRISEINDYVVPVFNQTVMKGKNGTDNVTVQMTDLQEYDRLYLEASLGCISDRDEGCPPWDHVATLYLCCDGATICDVEIGRWITSFRRRIGHWLTDISPLLPLLQPTKSAPKCTFVMKLGAWWAQPWVVSLNLRFQKRTSLLPQLPMSDKIMSKTQNLKAFKVISLFEGGVFDKHYNKKYKPINFSPTEEVASIFVYAVITGHGSDNNGCGEFCITSHTFVVNGNFNQTKTFSNAGTPLGCADRVPEGVVPNEHGTWLYGRDGWCDGQQVNPWFFEITDAVKVGAVNNINYYGLFDGKDPDPTMNPGLIRLVSFLVYYTK